MTKRLRLDLAYDGTAFSGWAVQPGRRTVAGVLGEALRTLFRSEVPLVVAGRTDAGVHATGQVAHIDVDARALSALAPRHLARGLPGGAAAGGLVGLRRRLAGLLPTDVRVHTVSLAPDGFDARFAALRRHYRYRVAVSEWGLPPLAGADLLWWRRSLDVDAMRQAASRLLGLHDFAAYCKPRPGATTIRELQAIRVDSRALRTGCVASHDEIPEQLVEILVSADAFCHSMVRSLVGALLAVGEGRQTPERPAELLRDRVRTSEIAVAPAHGLTLIGVDYPADDHLRSRAAATRALRSARDVAHDAVRPDQGPGQNSDLG